MDLDWSGNAQPPNCKKYLPAPKANLENSASGLTVGGRDSWRPHAGRGASQPRHKRNTFDLIGGPVHTDPGSTRPKKWQTESQAYFSQEKTRTDQLTQRGRARLIRGKQMTTPAFLDVRPPFDDNVAQRLRGGKSHRLNKLPAAATNVQCEHCGIDEFSLIGFRRSPPNQSLLGGLGVSVLASRGMEETGNGSMEAEKS